MGVLYRKTFSLSNAVGYEPAKRLAEEISGTLQQRVARPGNLCGAPRTCCVALPCMASVGYGCPSYRGRLLFLAWSVSVGYSGEAVRATGLWQGG